MWMPALIKAVTPINSSSRTIYAKSHACNHSEARVVPMMHQRGYVRAQHCYFVATRTWWDGGSPVDGGKDSPAYPPTR
jgi:hypothetical protein